MIWMELLNWLSFKVGGYYIFFWYFSLKGYKVICICGLILFKVLFLCLGIYGIEFYFIGVIFINIYLIIIFVVG